MKTTSLLALLILMMVALPASAQVAETMAYQGYLTDTEGIPLDGSVALTFALYDTSVGGSSVWTETQSSVPLTNGVFSVQLGSIASLDGVDLGGSLYLGVKVGSGQELSPRVALSAVPYALSVRGLRFEAAENPLVEGPNVIGGWSGNEVADGIAGGTIAGGGDPDNSGIPRPNKVLGDYGTVGGGMNNIASVSATVGGGAFNQAGSSATVAGGGRNIASGAQSVVGGGQENTASGVNATIGGGQGNLASNTFATIMGGVANTASGVFSTVAGGTNNAASGGYSFAAGRQAKAEHNGAFVWADNTTADFASTAEKQFLIRAAGGVGIGTNAPTSLLTVAGVVESTEGGIKFPDGTVQTTAAAGGGVGNTVSGNGATVGGGAGNTASGSHSTVSGGSGNTASAQRSFVGGGNGNEASQLGAVVGGGSSNNAGGGFATVSGGQANTATGFSATIVGGAANAASGGYSLAAGRRAKAEHDGAFVWGGNINEDFASTASNQFLIRGAGGMGLNTNAPQGMFHITQASLGIQSSDFSDDELVVEGSKPVIGIYGNFQSGTRPGLVLAGVDGGNVVDKWGIVREYFGGNRLLFTYGLNSDHTENETAMSLSQSGPVAERFTASADLGSTGTPTPGAHFRDNVVYAWAHVQSDGKAAESYGCTVTKLTGNGRYRVTFKRALPNGASAVVTVQTLNDPVIATAVTNANQADVATKVFNGSAFLAADYGFYIQVVGRP